MTERIPTRTRQALALGLIAALAVGGLWIAAADFEWFVFGWAVGVLTVALALWANEAGRRPAGSERGP